MKNFVLAFIVALGLGLAASSASVAAPIAAAPIGQAASTHADDGIQRVWYDRFGVWHPNRPIRRAPIVVAPPIYVAPPVVVVPRVPVCRSVRVCGPRGCYWTRRC